MSNSFGEMFQVVSFGESHGRCVGILIDGCPSGLSLGEEDIQKEVDKRRPEPSAGQTARREEDKVEILSGVFEGHTTGAPLVMLVWNKDVESLQYEKNRFIPRPGHADFTAFMKYGGFNDFRGGGRFSGRITLGMVMAGAVAKKILSQVKIEILAHTVQIGEEKTGKVTLEDIRGNVYSNPLRCADPAIANKMLKLVERVRKEGDSLGGVIEGIALNIPAGLGEPVFNTLDGELSRALLAIPAVKGVEFGAGFSVADLKGSENNDPFRIKGKKIVTETNKAGGILGGISNGMPLVLRIAIKPTPSIALSQLTVDLKSKENTEINIKGRHDACIVPRAVIVVESMMAVTICDMALQAGILPRVIK
jgi:chorismate synthase